MIDKIEISFDSVTLLSLLAGVRNSVPDFFHYREQSKRYHKNAERVSPADPLDLYG